MPPVPYPPGQAAPVTIDPIDPDEVALIGFDWTDWLTGNGGGTVDESTWTVTTGGALGDGTTQITRKGKDVIPPTPTLTSPNTTCHVYVDGAAVGDTITVSNHIRSGQLTAEKSAVMTVGEH